MTARRPRPRSVLPIRIGIDTGGTFTDLVVDLPDGTRRHTKVVGTAGDPAATFARALAAGIADCPAPGTTSVPPVDVRHGTTLATNTVLTGSGARVVFVGTEGHEESPLLGRGDRAEVFALAPTRKRALVESSCCVGAPGRLDAAGRTLAPLEERALAAWVRKVSRLRPEAVALSILHATRAPDVEATLAAALAPLGVPVSCGSALTAESREGERAETAVLDAYVAPRLRSYLAGLAAIEGASVTLLASDGGRLSLADAARRPSRLLLSGPAGGAAAAAALAARLGVDRALSFDVGGTSTDVCWIEGGAPEHAVSLSVGEYRASLLSVAVETVGAGGGSVVDLDAGGALLVGPRSAGAEPGSAAMGRGGPFTLADAWCVLGRLPPAIAGGSVVLDRAAAERAGKDLAARAGVSLARMADGVVLVAAQHTARALRRVSAARGRDPTGATLVAFGGAGPLLAADAAAALGIARVCVPTNPGTFAAAGTLEAPRSHHDERDATTCTNAQLRRLAVSLKKSLLEAMAAESGAAHVPPRARRQPHAEIQVEARFVGQDEGVLVPFSPRWREAARQAHVESYGFELAGRALEAVRLVGRVADAQVASRSPARAPKRASGQSDMDRIPRARMAKPRHGCIDREHLAVGRALRGPVRIDEPTATTWVPPGWLAYVLAEGTLVLARLP